MRLSQIDPARQPHRLEVPLPLSKSIYNRLLLVAHLAGVPTHGIDLRGNDCRDLEAMQRAIASWQQGEETIHVGESGTAARFLLIALSALGKGKYQLVGSGRLPTRPMQEGIHWAENLFGAKVTPLEPPATLPLRITPHPEASQRLRQEIVPTGQESSQFTSALLLVAPYLNGGITIRKSDSMVSYQYISLTLECMRRWGAVLEESATHISVRPEGYDPQKVLHDLQYPIPDWSSAGYLYQWVACAQNPLEIVVPHLHLDAQPDCRIAQLMETIGIGTDPYTLEGVNGLRISQSGNFLEKIEQLQARQETYQLSDTPDLVPTWVVTLLMLGIPFRIVGVEHLRHKESDRIGELLRTATAYGYDLCYSGKVLSSLGFSRPMVCPSPLVVGTKHDHRMAMAWAAHAWLSDVEVADPESVNKSFPTFWQTFAQLQS